MRIRTFILVTSLAVGALVFGGVWIAAGRMLDEAIKSSALRTSDAVARVTFNGMYQVMSTGWKREQAEAFLKTMHEAGGGSGLSLQIFRNASVVDLYGEIEQPPPDREVLAVLDGGDDRHLTTADSVRHIYPLRAEERCLRCHRNVWPGTVLGAIEVRQEFGPVLERARRDLLMGMALLLPLVAMVALGAVSWVGRRIERSTDAVRASFDEVGSIDDLKRIAHAPHDLGFREFNQIGDALAALVDTLRRVAVDKDLLAFEIGLLERFVITSDVVRDWKRHAGRLLIDINVAMPTQNLFAAFEADDGGVDVDVFWCAVADPQLQATIEARVREAVLASSALAREVQMRFAHHFVEQAEAKCVPADPDAVVRVKSLIVDAPRVVGVVGVVVGREVLADETRQLALESVLSTLLNVVGSVNAIQKYTHDLEYYATRDPLTDLFNQRVFWELAAYEVGRATRHGYSFGLLLIDLDNFKVINDTHGHAVGDKYLKHFARQVQGALRAGDILARYGGDEFVAIVPEAGLEALTAAAGRVRAAIEEMRVDIGDGQQLHGTGSIGLAVFPDHARSAKDLFLFADNMMYKAKSEGKARVAVPTMDDVVEVFRDATQKSAQVLAAIEEKRVLPFYQPILDIASGRIVAYEVLSRIEVDGGIMRADEFVEIAERMGVIHRLDAQVIGSALAGLAAGGHGGEIFFNLSPRALVLDGFVDDICRIAAASAIPASRIVFEITERDTVKNIAKLESYLNRLKEAGFRLAIDDFGSGFSSFHYLRRFPIDYLKIEGDFIANMLASVKDRAVVTSIVALAREMGIAIVAEHVESQEVLDELRGMGVQLAQGYHIGRPAPAPVG